MTWIALLLCLSIQVLADDISDDYAGKDDDAYAINANGNQHLPLRKKLSNGGEPNNEDGAQTRRMFEWFNNLFGMNKKPKEKRPKPDSQEIVTEPPDTIDQVHEIETVGENVLDSISRIAHALEKISNSVDLQLRMIVAGQQSIRPPSYHPSMRRFHMNPNHTEHIEMNTYDKQPHGDAMDYVYRIARAVEKINNNLDVQLHMMIANKEQTNYAARSGADTRRGTFEWLYNSVFGKKKPEPAKATTNGTITLYHMLTSKYDKHSESEILQGVNRVGYALERIDKNLELQIHMRLDCDCDDQTRSKRSYGTDRKTTRRFNSEDNTFFKDINVRIKRDVILNSSVLETDLSDTTAPTISRSIDAPDDVNTTKAPITTTESVVEKSEKQNEIPKATRRQAPDEIKLKLLNYIYDSYNEIINKVEPLSILKAQYQNENLYKMGYIMSNIDTLEVNLKNLKKDVDFNKHGFDETKILSVLDTFMASNRIVTSLIESLKLLDKQVLKARPTTFNTVV